MKSRSFCRKGRSTFSCLTVVIGLCLVAIYKSSQLHVRVFISTDPITVATIGTPLPVYLIPHRDERPYASSNLRSIGLRYSKRLVQVNDPDTDHAVWVVNFVRIPAPKDHSKCNWLIDHVEKSKRRKELQILIYDITDLGRTEIDVCVQRLSDSLGGRQHVKYARRNLVQGRDFSCFCMASSRDVPYCDRTCYNETSSLDKYNGEAVLDDPSAKFVYNGVIAQYHIPLRSDLLPELNRLEQERRRQRSNRITAVAKNDDDRPGDVAHIWNIQPNVWSGSLRNRVTEALLSLNATVPNLAVLADIVSPRSNVGRNTVNVAYAQALLDYKIIVVAQRDGWEDHMRLTEALVSGALVLSDPMIHMPCGYEDGVNIVIYTSIRDLKEKILYYLDNPQERHAIGRAGKKLALEQHRPVHQLERFLLGKWPTSSDDPVIPILE